MSKALTVHNSEDKTQSILRLVSVRQIDHETRVNSLQYLLFYEYHRFTLPLFYTFFL